MKRYCCGVCLCVLTMALTGNCFGGDASPGMATHGSVRVPQPGMVTDTFGAPRMPNLGMLKKPFKSPMVRERRRQDISATTKTPQAPKSKLDRHKP